MRSRPQPAAASAPEPDTTTKPQEEHPMKALVGSWEHRPYQLLAEVTALRTRVRELEEALEKAERENAQLREAIDAGLGAPTGDEASALTRR